MHLSETSLPFFDIQYISEDANELAEKERERTAEEVVQYEWERKKKPLEFIETVAEQEVCSVRRKLKQGDTCME